MPDRPTGDPRRRSRPRSGAGSAAPSRSPAPGRAAASSRSPTPARGTVRPGARRSGGNGTGAAARTSAPRPRRRVTGRAVVLGVVLLALALSYVFPLRVYLGQQAEVSQLRAEQREQRARIDRLATQAALWSDDNYIRIQARQRLYFGEPGEMLLLPVSEEDQPPPDAGAELDQPAVTPQPWWESLWTSIESANRAGPAPDAEDPEEAG